MNRCHRFEEEALVQLERGLPLDPHFESCPDCRAARAAYGRLRGTIASLGESLEPSSGWRERVWQAIHRGERPRDVRRVGWLRLAAVATAGGLLLLALPMQRPNGPPGLDLELEAGGGAPRRTVEAQPGEHLTLRASTGGAVHSELRVYLNDKSLVLRCSTEPPCRPGRSSLEATIVLDERGAYQSVLFVSPRALPEPGGHLDRDAGAALDQGAQVVLGPEVLVK